MPEFICNTSPLQYLHQLGRLDLLAARTDWEGHYSVVDDAAVRMRVLPVK